MKLKLSLIGLIALTATCPVLAQTNAPAATTNAAPADATTATTAATNAAPADAATTTVTTTTTTTTTPAADTTAPAAAATVAATTTTAADTTAPAAATPAPADTSSSGVTPAGTIIPLIVMDEVPLTDAIKNLARQANLNYMLDPKISYGTPDASGNVRQQPSVSLRWENLTADQALSAVLDSYNLVINDDPKTHVARITVKDPTAPDPLVTKIIQLKYASATNLVVSAQTVFTDKRSKVFPDSRTSQIVVVATEKEMIAVDELVARLDSPTKQVLIEAKLVETSSNPTTQKGVDWSGTLQAQHVSFGNGSGFFSTPTAGTAATPPTVTQLTIPSTTPGGPSSLSNFITTGTPATAASPGLLNGILGGGPGITASTDGGANPATFFLNADGVSAVLSFLNTSADAQVLSTPRAVTLDNEEAVLSVTTAQPIFATTAGTQGSPGGSEVTYTNLGTILHVTPRISANNNIALTVIPEVSDLGPVVTKTVAGLVNQADSFIIRKVITRVLIPSGNTLVMGGLVTDNRTKGNTKVPVLGDIPGLGWAFRQETKSQNKANLIIFITPTIVHDEDFQPTETAFLKTKVPNLKNTDFGAWDSGEPQDWSKLFHSKSASASVDVEGGVVYPDDAPKSN